MIRLFLLALACVAAFAGATDVVARGRFTSLGSQTQDGMGGGAVLFREGDNAGAVSAWTKRLEARTAGPHERARLAYNLGVAAHANGELLRAIAWFEVTLRLDPRNKKATHNLELARADAGLEPKASGDITSAATALLRRVEPHESRWLAFLAALFLVVLGVASSFTENRAARVGFIALLLLQPVLWAPLVRRVLVDGSDPVMVIAKGLGADVHPAPDAGSERLGRVPPGAFLERIEEYQEWTKVLWKGDERWISREDAFPLAR